MRKCAFRKWRNKKFRENQGISKEELYRRNREQKLFGFYKHISAPQRFSLINNPNEVLAFIEKMEQAFAQKKATYIKLRNVKTMTDDAIVLLLSKALEFKEKGIPINGNNPIDKIIRTRIENSGFFNILYDTKKNPGYELKDGSFVVKSDKTMYTHGTKNVDAQLTHRLIGESSQHLWGQKRRCRGVQRIFIELMQNTNNHASRKPGEKYWWINISKQNNPKRIGFSFIDYGMGIFKSLETKSIGNKFFDWANKLVGKCNTDLHYEVLKLMMQGDFHQTVTGKPYRGKGIPGIYNEIRKNSITKLIIISNDAYANATSDDFFELQYPLDGTFVYFEVDNNCKNLDWKDEHTCI